MKKFIFLLLALMLSATICWSQSSWFVVNVKDLNGNSKELKEFSSDKGTTLLVFWKTCCPNNITMIEELYELWLDYDDENHPIKVVLVSLDDTRSVARVRPIVVSNGWEWDVIMDTNEDIARAYNVIMPPQWIAFDKSGKEIYRTKISNGFSESEIYFEELIDIINKNN